HLLRAERLPQEVKDDGDARERGHRHQNRGQKRDERQQQDDLQRRRHRSDAVDLKIEIVRRHGLTGRPRSAPASVRFFSNDELIAPSSVTIEICCGVMPSRRRRPSTATITSERRSPSGTAVSTVMLRGPRRSELSAPRLTSQASATTRPSTMKTAAKL